MKGIENEEAVECRFDADFLCSPHRATWCSFYNPRRGEIPSEIFFWQEVRQSKSCEIKSEVCPQSGSKEETVQTVRPVPEGHRPLEKRFERAVEILCQ